MVVLFLVDICYHCFVTFRFYPTQLDRLSELFLDLAKAMFVAGLAVPAVLNAFSVVISIRAILLGCVFTTASLYFSKEKEQSHE